MKGKVPRISARCTEEMRREVKKAAADQGVTVEQLIIEAVVRELERRGNK